MKVKRAAYVFYVLVKSDDEMILQNKRMLYQLSFCKTVQNLKNQSENSSNVTMGKSFEGRL